MAITKITTEQLLDLRETLPVFDVRSPGEYAHARIPGAISFPLFTDEERRVVGTAYKQQSRRQAIREGLAYFGKNLLPMVETAERLAPGEEVVVHCWRGGMRSAAVAWLLDLYGFQVYLLTGGYKAFRRLALQQFEKPWPLSIVGGYTGSNKTGLLHALEEAGHFTIDLEKLAGHKGSAFGNLGQQPQPSQEHFENELALQLLRFNRQQRCSTIWIEHETQRIGQINLPKAFFDFFSAQPYYFIDVPFEERLRFTVEHYGRHTKDSLVSAILRITRKLGGLEAKAAIAAIVDDDLTAAFAILLKYYDRLYHKNEAKRDAEERTVYRLDSPVTDAKHNLKLLTDYAEQQRGH